MHRIDTPTAQKDKFGAGKNGFSRGNPQTGVPATDLDDDYFDAIQEELAGLVESGGITLDKADCGQFFKVLKLMFAANTDSIGAFAALVGAANKLPYFTGSKSAALADLTAFAREILAQTNAAGVISKIGLGTAVTKGVGTGTGQIPDMSAFASGTNHFKLPSGYIVQWGSGQSSNGAFVSTFQIPFTSANYCLIPIVYSTTEHQTSQLLTQAVSHKQI
ncbi:hypothetical protein [Kluyvera sp. 142486]|uniref:gp53-like domain-containing protein n=1 Tax=Kluyvera sp. 142486 TaxID=3390050 RepID=UPI00397F131A